MSALGGLYYYDGKCLNAETLIALGTSMNVHGPDGGREVCADSVGFTFRAFHTNRESRLDDQPYVSRDRVIVTWDGRLDNRET